MLFEVTKFAAGYHNKTVVRNCTFQLAEGEVAGLIGLNGSGKSTLVKAICGLTQGTGTVLVDGCDLGNLSERKRALHLSYLAQRAGVHTPLPALDIVLMGFSPVLRMLSTHAQHES